MSSTPRPSSSRVSATGYTPIGVDLGEKRLVAAAPADADPDEAFVIDGEPLRERYDILVEATEALQGAWFDTTRGEAQVFAAMHQQLRPQLFDAAHRLVRYAGEFATPLLVLEDLSFRGAPLWERRTVEKLGAWLLPALQGAITEVALDAGLPISYVDAEYTSQACHGCAKLGRLEDDVVVCTTDDCPVGAVCRDRSAALTIAGRAAD
ncbi:zinc ribbon domain-containing protein [Haloarcula sp. S1AR25-5A]|uniref:Zinc ribbon domain-containing protein n=1 Tax=Haloarcula terrestris TaxID=2950533 RepID=A0AAE4JGV2_9EURY|nr:zinc ribbon domain-containing protein [Haloarcula terrestris]MDS0220880.1 zinc ribbon domain-containing protein [Haloarcula terrestris]